MYLIVWFYFSVKINPYMYSLLTQMHKYMFHGTGLRLV